MGLGGKDEGGNLKPETGTENGTAREDARPTRKDRCQEKKAEGGTELQVS
jgi:hypothetical protein